MFKQNVSIGKVYERATMKNKNFLIDRERRREAVCGVGGEEKEKSTNEKCTSFHIEQWLRVRI